MAGDTEDLIAGAQRRVPCLQFNLSDSRFHMNEKYLQAFALAYMIGWLLSRMPKKGK